VSIREIACYLSMLEGGKVEDKLEFVFRVYDSDGNEYLDSQVLTGPYVICLETDLKSVFGWLHSDIRIIHQGQVV